jgi:hypothetical protein
LNSGILVPGDVLTLAGAVNHSSGSVDAGTQTIIFNGNSMQTIPANMFSGRIKNLTIDNGNGVVLGTGADITVTNALALRSGTLNIGANTMFVNVAAGGLTRGTGSIDAGAGKIAFAGTAAVNIPAGSLAGNINNLTISNNAGVTLNDSKTITGFLAVDGLLTPAADVVIDGPGSLRGSGTVQVTAARGNGTNDFTNQYKLAIGSLANMTVEFAGAATQNAAGDIAGSVKISNSNGVSMTGDATIGKTLTLNSGALSIGSNTLTLNGPVVNGSGSLAGSGSARLIIGDNNAATLKFTTVADTLKYFAVNPGATATLSTPLNMVGSADPGTVVVNGTLNTGGNLFIRSNANGTARIGTSTGIINGDVTIERFIPAKPVRKWTFLSSPVSTSVRNGWQQQIFVTGPGTGGTPCGSGGKQYNSNGFDDTQNDPSSIFTYEPVPAAGNTSYYTPVPNTFIQLTPGTGYRVNIRGNRNTPGACAKQINYSGPTPPADSVTLSVTGAYSKTASKELNFTSANVYTLVGNPYPGELSLKSVLSDNNSVINAKAWLYCGNLANTGDVYTVMNNGQLTNGEYLPDANKVFTNGVLTDVVISSGEAFFVEAKSAGSITFNEQQKTTTVASGNGIYSRPVTPFVWTNYTRIHLLKETDSVQEMDNIIVRFKNDKLVNNTQYGAFDGASLNSVASSIASLKAGSRMAIQTRRLDFVKRDTVYMAVNAAAGNYRMTFTAYEKFTKAAYIYLIDKYLHTSTNMKQQPQGYPFSITTDTLSRGSNRFMVVFSTTPINTTPAATKSESKPAKDTANKNNTVVPLGLYPNPVHSQLNIHVQYTNDMHYHINILSVTGRLVMVKEGNVKGGVVSISTASLSQGIYMASLYFADGVHYSQQFIKQ